MIICEKHGLSTIVQVSPDIQSGRVRKIISVDYDYYGDVIETFYLSEVFGSQYGVKGSQCFSLPEVFPDWVSLMIPMCEKCFLELSDKVVKS